MPLITTFSPLDTVTAFLDKRHPACLPERKSQNHIRVGTLLLQGCSRKKYQCIICRPRTLQKSCRAFARRACGQWTGRGRSNFLQPRKQLLAAQTRKHQIEQHKVGFCICHGQKRFRAGIGPHRAVSRAGQRLLQEIPNGGVIVHNQIFFMAACLAFFLKSNIF